MTAPVRTRRDLGPRTVAPDSHRAHGTRAKYVLERCGCGECRAAARAAQMARRRALSRPDEVWLPYVPALAVRRHIAALSAFGIGHKRVALLAGVPHGSIAKIVYGDPKRVMPPSRRVRPSTALRILAVQATLENLGPRQPVPAAEYLAMLDDLVSRGWTKAWIATQIHHPGARSIQLGTKGCHGRPDTIGAGAAVRIREVYRRLEGRSGPGRRS